MCMDLCWGLVPTLSFYSLVSPWNIISSATYYVSSFSRFKNQERKSGNRCQIEGSNQAIILAAWFIALAFCLLAMSPSPAPAEIVARGHLLTHLPPGDADRTRQLGLPQHLTSCRLLPPAEFGFVPCFRLSPSSTPYLSLFI